ncbi:MAG: hypothetical protein QM747_07845 [Nocardioides sp.]
MGAESERVRSLGRLEDGLREAGEWYHWGPYVSERQWGTVREDYSADGDAWNYLPHDDARSRAYRWGEDGLAGFCDIEQRLCLGLALWNHADPILKERIFGLTGPQGNHGEDAKEYWWYTDATPTHSWNSWRYHYPQCAFPYRDLVAENARRGRHEPEYELLDTGVFDEDRYWVVDVNYAKAAPHDVLMRVRVTNAGPDPAAIDVLPTVWFRNTWSWHEGADRPELSAGPGTTVTAQHPWLGDLEIIGGTEPVAPTLLFCENETNTGRLFAQPGPAHPKDGINDHVCDGAGTVNPARRGTKAAFWYRLQIEPGDTAELRIRLRPHDVRPPDDPAITTDFDDVMVLREREADEFYAELLPTKTPAEEARVARQALAGMLWGKQFYAYDVARWLDGDPANPPAPAARLQARNSRWRTFDAFDIMSMPDPWEYPWFAAWDMGFHALALAHIDPGFAKYQLVLLCREWFQHPNGALPAYEWSFDDVNPPVHAWAALEVFAIDGAWDLDFLERIFDKLLVNFTWWVNREDCAGNNLFEGGFLGLDNIGPIDRDHVPAGYRLEQCDATAWMAAYAVHMATIAAVLRRHGHPTFDLVLKFLEHIAQIHDVFAGQELWDDEDGFYYDRLVAADGTGRAVKARTLVGVLPLLAMVILGEHTLSRTAVLGKGFARWGVESLLSPDNARLRGAPGERRLLVGVASHDRVGRVLTRLFDEQEFLSPYGLRSLSAYHRDHPYEIEVDGSSFGIDYEPAESTTPMFGGNSNWRGPVWMPLNFLVAEVLRRLGWFYGDEELIEYPTGSGRRLTYAQVADDLRDRLISLFLPGADGRRPCFGHVDRMQDDPRWRDNILFYEYFHGDNGAGIGASHQTGWTGVVADLILRKNGRYVPTLFDLLESDDPT